MVVHAEDAGHRAGRITGELDDREAVARLALTGDHVDAVPSRPDEIEEPVVDDLEVAVIGQRAGELREPGMRRRAGIEDVVRHSTALLLAQLGAGYTRPAAHQAEGVTDAEKRGCGVRRDGVEEIE